MRNGDQTGFLEFVVSNEAIKVIRGYRFALARYRKALHKYETQKKGNLKSRIRGPMASGLALRFLQLSLKQKSR